MMTSMVGGQETPRMSITSDFGDQYYKRDIDFTYAGNGIRFMDDKTPLPSDRQHNPAFGNPQQVQPQY